MKTELSTTTADASASKFWTAGPKKPIEWCKGLQIISCRFKILFKFELYILQMQNFVGTNHCRYGTKDSIQN